MMHLPQLTLFNLHHLMLQPQLQPTNPLPTPPLLLTLLQLQLPLHTNPPHHTPQFKLPLTALPQHTSQLQFTLLSTVVLQSLTPPQHHATTDTPTQPPLFPTLKNLLMLPQPRHNTVNTLNPPSTLPILVDRRLTLAVPLLTLLVQLILTASNHWLLQLLPLTVLQPTNLHLPILLDLTARDTNHLTLAHTNHLMHQDLTPQVPLPTLHLPDTNLTM